MKRCDLHCHSVFSDGTCTPEQLVALACEAGLSALALTDHNTLDGLVPFFRAAEGRLEVCGGCEFTTEAEGQELHLLGLFLELSEAEPLQAALDRQRRRKAESNRETLTALAAAGYNVSYEEFCAFAGQGVKNRVHIARYLMEKGIVSGIGEAFGGLLSPGGGYYHEGRKLDFYGMISKIAEAGGLSVWAHPLFHVEQAECERILQRAKAAGLDGVEVYYSTYSEEETAFILEMSEKYGLLQSGGSDFHGENKPRIRLGAGFGELCIPYALYERMKQRCGAAKANGISMTAFEGADHRFQDTDIKECMIDETLQIFGL